MLNFELLGTEDESLEIVAALQSSSEGRKQYEELCLQRTKFIEMVRTVIKWTCCAYAFTKMKKWLICLQSFVETFVDVKCFCISLFTFRGNLVVPINWPCHHNQQWVNILHSFYWRVIFLTFRGDAYSAEGLVWF